VYASYVYTLLFIFYVSIVDLFVHVYVCLFLSLPYMVNKDEYIFFYFTRNFVIFFSIVLHCAVNASIFDPWLMSICRLKPGLIKIV